jgi:hypothetical protein
MGITEGMDGMEPLVKARLLADAIAQSLPTSIPIGALPHSSKLPFKIISLREMLFHRASALATPAVSLLEERNVVSGVLLTRALIETVAMLADLHAKLEAFVQAPDVEALGTFLMGSLFANQYKEGGVKDKYFTRSIMNSIDTLDKKSKGIRALYDQLSEYAHPNYNGVFGTFGKVDTDRFVLNLGPNIRDSGNGDVIGANALAAALILLVHYYDAMAELMTTINQHFEPGWNGSGDWPRDTP